MDEERDSPMNSDQPQKPQKNDAQATRAAIQLHLARFHHFKGQGQLKEAMVEFNRSLDAILSTLENARQMLRSVNKKFTDKKNNKETEPVNPVKKERISPEAVFVEYPDGKWTLVKDVIPE
ncbi:MAG: hypothetical protein HZA19_04235 [Nitrospirae bacterium]|nr:hypothetical protein [Nitrospirota bacterium]